MDAATETAAPKFVDAGKRMGMVPLEHPIEFGGKVYDKIALRRMTAQDVADYIERVSVEAKETPDKFIRFPIYFHTDGAAVPSEVFTALDADDSEKVQEAALNFLPRSFRVTSTPVAE